METLGVTFASLLLCSILVRFSNSLGTISPGRVITDGETLVSGSRRFELGFFGPSNYSNSRYLGIWYKNITPRVVVWVANREAPLLDDSGALNLTIQGVLVLVDGTNTVHWSSNTSTTVRNPVVKLLDSANLVVLEKDNEDQTNFLWQGFDFPSDTLLSGLRIGKDLQTGFERYLTAWKSTDDPSRGQFSIHIDARGYPQMFVKKGDVVKYRAGSWNGISWTGTPFLAPNPSFKRVFEFDQKGVYYKFEASNGSALIRTTLTTNGVMLQNSWNDQLHDWQVISSSRTDTCENYGMCGAYSSCTDPGSPVCSCLHGFVPKSPSEWNSGDWMGGCVRRTPLDCDPGNRFLNHSRIRIPDTSS